MKSIHQLIPDIYELTTKKGWQDGLTVTIPRGEPGVEGNLRLSRLGPTCPRAFWYSLKHPNLAEPLPPYAQIKYCYGHIIEQLVLQLARKAGHQVEGEQDELDVDGVKGHRDCVIDGCLVDIKSQSSRALEKLKSRTLALDDPFGYLDQLDGYSRASLGDNLVKVKDKAYLLGVDKTLGHMVLYEHECRHDAVIAKIQERRRIAGLASPPACECGTRPEGKSGNIGLDMRASYSAYKYCCFPHLRTFLYADGPKYLTHVARIPDVPEVYH